ncbi:hypothetical protein GCM10028810_58210 [Spirosoma litoris]
MPVLIDNLQASKNAKYGGDVKGPSVIVKRYRRVVDAQGMPLTYHLDTQWLIEFTVVLIANFPIMFRTRVANEISSYQTSLLISPQVNPPWEAVHNPSLQGKGVLTFAMALTETAVAQ